MAVVVPGSDRVMEREPKDLEATVKAVLAALERTDDRGRALSEARELLDAYGQGLVQQARASSLAEFEHQTQPLIDALVALASLDFTHRLPVTGRSAAIDGIATGLNMLAEEMEGRLEEERALRAKLLHADRLAAVGQLAAGVAHEVNNPATYVLANLEFLGQFIAKLRAGSPRPGPDELDEAASFVLECNDGMRRITSVVGDLRTFSRSEVADETLDVSEVLTVAARMVHKTVSYRAQLELDLEPLPSTQANRSRLGQAFTNLLVNAAQAIKEGDPEANRVKVSAAVVDQKIRVVIEDTGAGMTPEVQRRVFEPFFTTKPMGEGTGLGLSLTAEIIRQHGGTISFVSTPGKGTTFEVLLPVKLPAPLKVAAAPQAAAPQRLKLLLVDDEPLVLKAYLRQLKGRYDVTGASSGAEAVELLRRNDYDAVICDLMMPDVDGAAVYEAALSHRPALAKKFVFVSGGAFTERTRRFQDELEGRLLPKPVDFARLDAVIAQLHRQG